MSQAQAALYYSTWQKLRSHTAANNGYTHEACVLCASYEFTLNTLIALSAGQVKRDLSDRKTFAETARSVRADDVTLSHPFGLSLERRAELWLADMKVADDLGGQHA